MKRLWIAALAVMLSVNLSGCKSDDNTQYPWKVEKSRRNVQNEDKDITLQIDDNTLMAKGAQLTIYNNSNMDISFGSQYFIQLNKNDSWYDIDIGVVDWTAELFNVAAKGKDTIKFDWSYIYGELPSGKYRFVKGYTQVDKKSFVFCEFEIP